MGGSSSKGAKKTLGLTRPDSTQGGYEVSAPSATDTKRRGRPVNATDSKPRRRKCKCCKQPFTPSKRGALYCSAACRKRAWARSNAKKRARQPRADEGLEIAMCAHCQRPYWREAGKAQQLYCKPGCRTLAARARRAAAEIALAGLLNMSIEKARDCSESWGMIKLARLLAENGLVYDAASRAWVYAVTVEIRQLQRQRVK